MRGAGRAISLTKWRVDLNQIYVVRDQIPIPPQKKSQILIHPINFIVLMCEGRMCSFINYNNWKRGGPTLFSRKNSAIGHQYCGHFERNLILKWDYFLQIVSSTIRCVYSIVFGLWKIVLLQNFLWIQDLKCDCVFRTFLLYILTLFFQM